MAHRSVGRSLLAGAAAGILGTVAMDAFQRTVARAAGRDKIHGAQTLRTGGPLQTRSEKEDPGEADDPAEKTVAALTEKFSGNTLTRQQRDRWGVVAHFAFGGLTGAAYGLAADQFPAARLGGGTVFGLAVWVGASLVTVPALGLSRKPHQYPLWVEAYDVAAHLVYGSVTDGALRPLLPKRCHVQFRSAGPRRLPFSGRPLTNSASRCSAPPDLPRNRS